jgi:hypothetical protein
MFTISNFWTLVSEINWPEISKKKVKVDTIKSKILKKYNKKQVKRMQDIEGRYSSILYKKLDKHDDYIRSVEGQGYGLSDDSFGDMISEVISRGHEFVRLVYDNPDIAMAMGRGCDKLKTKLEKKIPALKKYGQWNDYTEKFSYCLPYPDDFEKIDTKHYVELAKKYLHGKKSTEDWEGDEPAMNTSLLEDKIKEHKKEIKKLQELKHDMEMVEEVLTLISNKEFDKVKDKEAFYRDSITKLNKADLIHYGPANLLNDIKNFL